MSSSVLATIQRRLEEFYGLESAPDVTQFVRFAEDGEREQLLVREGAGELELTLVLPRGDGPEQSLDVWLQFFEGVSHFVYIAERARTELPATRLELELQAEVDKFVLLALMTNERLRTQRAALHARLYERVSFLHPAGSEAGDRYRLANELAARFVHRSIGARRVHSARRELRRFYRGGQTEKIRLALAA